MAVLGLWYHTYLVIIETLTVLMLEMLGSELSCHWALIQTLYARKMLTMLP